MGATITASSWTKLLAALGVAALALALLPLYSASAQDNGYPTYQDYPGDPGNIIERAAENGLPETVRYRGSSRHDTAAQIATDDQTYENAAGFRDSDEAIIARADDFPDSLAGSYMSNLLGAPLLLVDTVGSIEQHTEEALEIIDPETITVLGGTSAISDQAADDAAAIGSNDTELNRVSGTTRFETAEAIANAGDVAEVGGQRTAFLATGLEFADALAAGQIASNDEHPILLTTPDELHTAADRALDDQNVEHVVILGGTAAISSSVESAVEAKGIDTTRLGDADRAGTATQVAQFAIDEFGFNPAHISLATGFNFPDALAMGPHSGLEESPLILSRGDDFLDGAGGNDTQPSEFLENYDCETGSLHLAGGHNAMSTGVEDEAREASQCGLTLSMTPETATNEVGDDHELTVSILDSAGETITSEADGTTVELLVESATAGQDPVEVGTQSEDLDANGEATFTISDPQTSTVYEFTATTSFENEDGETEELEATATKTWVEDVAFDAVPISSAREVGEDFDNPLGPSGGDSDGALDAEVNVTTDNGEVSTELCVAYAIESVDGDYDAFSTESAAHIHLGGEASAGPVVVALSTPNLTTDFTDLTGFSEPLPTGGLTSSNDPFGYNAECVDIDAEVAAGIANSPGMYYFNAHTDAWPGGNTRGQLDGSWDGTDRTDADPVDLS